MVISQKPIGAELAGARLTPFGANNLILGAIIVIVVLIVSSPMTAPAMVLHASKAR